MSRATGATGREETRCEYVGEYIKAVFEGGPYLRFTIKKIVINNDDVVHLISDLVSST